MSAIRIRFRALLGDASRSLAEMGPFDLAALLMVLTISFYHVDAWYLAGPVAAWMSVGLIFPWLRRRAAFWFATTGVLGAAVIANWYSIDNHQYLYVYVGAALGLACLVDESDRERCLAKSSKLLIGAVMALAAGQKLFSEQYRSGAFFEYTLLTDHRLQSVSWLLGGMSLHDLELNSTFVSQLVAPSATVNTPLSFVLHITDGVRALAVFMTWGVVLLEAALAAIFLWPGQSQRLQTWRSGLLIAFIVGTYAVAPVIGFGWVLIILALAQLPIQSSRRRQVFLALFILLPLFKLSPARFFPALQRFL